jgi:glycosyltransferase involved in cell wall biosynthesis
MKKVAIFHCGMIYSGGGERIVLGQMDELKKRGYEVECWVPVWDKDRCFPDLIDDYDIKTFLPQLPNWVPYRHAMLMVVTSLLAPVFAGRFRNTDVIIGENQPGIWMAYCVSKVLGKEFTGYTCHPNRMVYQRNLTRKDLWKTEKDFYALSLVMIPVFKPLLKWLDRRSFRAAKNMLVNGWFVGEEVGTTYNIKWQGCPSGVEVKNFSPALDKVKRKSGPKSQRGKTDRWLASLGVKRPYLLFVGRHEVWKRIDLAIKALGKIREKIPEVELVIPGSETAHTRDLVKLTKELRLEGAVKWVGNLDQINLRRMFGESEVFVFPSIKEDFGIVMIEAMAAGCPVVAWDQGGPTDIVEHGATGYLAPLGDVEAYANYVVKLLEDDGLRKEMGAAGRQLAKEKFSWERHGDKLEKAMGGVMKR